MATTTKAPHMTEAELQAAALKLAQLTGWLVHHDRPARTAKGWRTPIQGTPGFPDAVLVRAPYVLFVEFKSDKGHLRPDQRRWGDELAKSESVFSAVEYHLWRPRDWRSGLIEEVLA